MPYTKYSSTSQSKCLVALLALILSFSIVPLTKGVQADASQRRYEVYKQPRANAPLPLAILAVKNFRNERFMRDLEIEVKNVSDKPIYYIRFGVALPNLKDAAGREFGFFMKYGNPALIDVRKKAGPQDLSLKPGETYVFKVAERIWQGFEDHAARANLSRAATALLHFTIDTVSFGDGTGFVSGGVFIRTSTVVGSTSKEGYITNARFTGRGVDPLTFRIPSRSAKVCSLDDCGPGNCWRWVVGNPDPLNYACWGYGGTRCPYDFAYDTDPEYPCTWLNSRWFPCGPGHDFNCFDEYTMTC